jgi:hypothetical protein
MKLYNNSAMQVNEKEVKTDIGEASDSSLCCIKRTIAHIIIWLALFVAFYGLTARDIQAQEMIQKPLWSQEIFPQIHLELDPDLKITPSIQDYADINHDPVIGTQDIPSLEKMNFAEKASTREKEKVKPDWSGMKRDSLYFVGYQVVVIGLLYVMPESVSGWTSEQKRSFSFNKWVEKVKEIGFDEDDWYLNYLAHPYWGATYYIRARERGLNKFHSFLYSALLSSLYEFGAEAFFEPPSIQDLVVTPCAGSLLGMYFEKIRQGIKAKGDQQSWYDKMVLVLTDPLGTVSKYTDRMLGITCTTELKSFRSPSRRYGGINPDHAKVEEFGAVNTVSKYPLGIEVKLVW